MRIVLLVCVVFFVPTEFVLSQDYGSTGIIDMPSAYLMEDGQLRLTIARDFAHEATAISYQVTPWLETTFRYTGLQNSWIWDRNIEVKLKLLEETDILPALAVGVRDIGGTALFGGEYLVASKTYGSFKGTLGMGWGRLSGTGPLSNPLAQLSSHFEERSNHVGRGGTLATNTFFSGSSVGLFGSIAYEVPGSRLSWIAEYSTDNYNYETSSGIINDNFSKINYGMRWRYSDQGSIQITNQNHDWAITTNILLDTKRIPNTSPLDYRQFTNRQENSFRDLSVDVNELLLFDSQRRGVIIRDGEVTESQENYHLDEITLVVSKSSNHYWPNVIANTLDVIDLHIPDDLEKANLIVYESGYQLYTIEVNLPEVMTDFKESDFTFTALAEDFKRVSTQDIPLKTPSVDLGLDMRQMFFDPDNPTRYWVVLNARTRYELPGGWALQGGYEITIYDEFDDHKRTSNSVLPRVRTDQDKYFKNSSHGLGHLFLSKQGKLNSELNYQIYAGYLEMMYAGVGFELLNYDPFERFAYGLSYNHVQQRSFDRGFGLRDYEADTFFVSGYWDSPFYDLNVALHAGQFLAGDRGATIDIRRSFASGWEVGAFATFTDVSAADFGEGSFDKGLYFSIPWSNLISLPMVNRSLNKMRFIQRDGGQYLDGLMGTNWFRMQQANPRNIQENIVRILNESL